MPKRVIVVFFCVLLVFSVLSMRLSLLAANTVYADAALSQNTYYLDFATGRGNFYDSQFRQLTNVDYKKYALVAPTSESYRMLFDIIDESKREELYSKIQRSTPFLMEIPTLEEIDAPVFYKAERYYSVPIATQLIGYCDSEGNGVSGLEYYLNDKLVNASTKESVYCVVNARGEFVEDETPQLVSENGTGFGVMLTLDASLQRICEAIAAETMEKGAIVVMETATGRVRASVSVPTYDPNNVAQSLNDENSPFINRVISSYNLGSVFKPLLAAVALENNYLVNVPYECTGSITVADHTYRCAYGRGHGEVDLEKALGVSCNTYFIEMGLKLGGESIVSAMQSVGFGESLVISNGLSTARGNIPTAKELENLGALASISFGQGTLTASPLQAAAFINTIANDGVYISPTFVEGYVDEYSQTLSESLYSPIVCRWISSETATTLQKMLVNVVDNGLGKSAQPNRGGAGGKTGTAQTGTYTSDGTEITQAWFAGFYPAENPQYTIAVLLDSSTKSSDEAGSIFARVANALSYFVNIS